MNRPQVDLNLLDRPPTAGRSREDAPKAGQGPAMSWLRPHDEY